MIRAAVVVSVLVISGCASSVENPIHRIGTMEHGPLREVSGIARSSFADAYWVHNDSGDSARLFAVTPEGRVVVPRGLQKRFRDEGWPGLTVHGASNVDWEDIAIADGMLYVAETGNNDNARRDLGVYVLPEPDPRSADELRALRFLRVRYPDQRSFPAEQWHFDCEALFVADGKLHFLTKHRLPGKPTRWIPGTKLYRLNGDSTTDVNVLELLGARDDLMLPTSADLSPDGERLAVLTYLNVWVFERPPNGGNWLDGRASRLALDAGAKGTNEAITWRDDETLIIANEQRAIFSIALSALRPLSIRARGRPAAVVLPRDRDQLADGGHFRAALAVQ